MNNQTILIAKPKSVSAMDKVKLTKAGFIIIENEDPYTGINFKTVADYEFLLCANCGERIYLLRERISVLRKNGYGFYCTQGHSNIFK